MIPVMPLAITPLYAVILTLIYIVLSARIIVMRRGERISLGWSGNAELQKRVRIHGNFAEYVPLALILLAMAELRGAGHFALNALCLLLVAARCAHIYAVSQEPPAGLQWRKAGVLGTGTVLIGACVLILLTA